MKPLMISGELFSQERAEAAATLHSVGVIAVPIIIGSVLAWAFMTDLLLSGSKKWVPSTRSRPTLYCPDQAGVPTIVTPCDRAGGKQIPAARPDVLWLRCGPHIVGISLTYKYKR